ncbi:hypothetical protein [Photobacterium proteolyticum]|uniref:hypothetical protein n=1 Tax=Photobacterium proteolyticum TaxID=1903952 RepID=UPI00158824F6|nr:hypothetical protein [Photobacterium proteolyticum]
MKPQLLKIIANWNDTLTQGITEEEIELVKRINPPYPYIRRYLREATTKRE